MDLQAIYKDLECSIHDRTLVNKGINDAKRYYKKVFEEDCCNYIVTIKGKTPCVFVFNEAYTSSFVCGISGMSASGIKETMKIIQSYNDSLILIPRYDLIKEDEIIINWNENYPNSIPIEYWFRNTQFMVSDIISFFDEYNILSKNFKSRISSTMFFDRLIETLNKKFKNENS